MGGSAGAETAGVGGSAGSAGGAGGAAGEASGSGGGSAGSSAGRAGSGPIAVHGAALVLFTGDSITAMNWMGVKGGLVDQINAQLASQAASPISVVNTGVAGDTAAVLSAQVAARITSYNPDIIVIEEGINGESETPSQMGSDYASILDQIRAWSSTVPIVCVSILAYYEQWVPGPPPAAIPANDVTPYNVALKAACDSFVNTTWQDNYGPFYVYESIHNAPAPGLASGVLLKDDRHPNPTGQLQMGDWMIGIFDVLP